MPPLTSKFLTAKDYLSIERRAETKSEYFNGQMYAMAGAKYPHVRINSNLTSLLNTKLARSTCMALSSDMRIHVERTGLYTYPDISVVCGDPLFQDRNEDILLNPKVIVEILSPSTEGYDRGAKFMHYQSISSLEEYVLISQSSPVIQQFYLPSRDRDWQVKITQGMKSSLVFASLPVKVKFQEIYRGIKLAQGKASVLRERSRP